ncbi:hypothetical protein [Leptospira interrogans]|nr:hypothetical protein [Leptospira interrogans]
MIYSSERIGTLQIDSFNVGTPTKLKFVCNDVGTTANHDFTNKF